MGGHWLPYSTGRQTYRVMRFANNFFFISELSPLLLLPVCFIASTIGITQLDTVSELGSFVFIAKDSIIDFHRYSHR